MVGRRLGLRVGSCFVYRGANLRSSFPFTILRPTGTPPYIGGHGRWSHRRRGCRRVRDGHAFGRGHGARRVDGGEADGAELAGNVGLGPAVGALGAHRARRDGGWGADRTRKRHVIRARAAAATEQTGGVGGVGAGDGAARGGDVVVCVAVEAHVAVVWRRQYTQVSRQLLILPWVDA